MASKMAGNSVVVLAVACLFAITFGCTGKQSTRGRDEENTNALALAQLINQERLNNGISGMTWDVGIAAVEQAHAEWIAAKDPPGAYIYPYVEAGEGGKVFTDRLDDASIPYTTATEYGYADASYTNAALVFPQLPDDVFTNASYTRFGIGYARPPEREPGKHYWVIGLVDE